MTRSELRRRVGLIPELDVTNLQASLSFYADLLGFHVVFERATERFAYLAFDSAQLMLEEAAGPGRRFRTAPLDQPFGRGVNFQLEVPDVDAVYARIVSADLQPIIEMEERWYETRSDTATAATASSPRTEAGNRQFVVADPDGYLWRPFRDLGSRPISRGSA